MSSETPIRAAGEPEEPYCGNCGYSFKGLGNSAKCPECGKAIVEVLMRRGFPARQGKRYRSKAKIFGWPVLDIALGPSGTERRGKARGIIAIGDVATGWLAVGGIARGIVAVGGVAIGIFSLVGMSIGVLTALSGVALSLGMANGGLAVGAVATGGLAFGIVAQGGLALGHLARGGLAYGNSSSPAWKHFHWLLGGYPPTGLDSFLPMVFTLTPAILAGIFIFILAVSRLRSSAIQLQDHGA